jgi:hypothetical protein
MMHPHRLATAAALITLVASPFLLVACGTGPLTFDKPGVMATERERDQKECGLLSADDPDHGELLSVYRIDRDSYVNCMVARGYTAMRGSKVVSR